ncbi:SipW-dependent-type signal peptide-containing protein [Rhodococcus sp. SGAir0479]|uniref:SipW-dependent-type signal peptide-containing protein n=1 Tax=Rhodococcus sp. SGAir0479 TaxID=2567884 RepID=UPI0015862672|nr:SipW-dependent-type signal peptide-containing protein [Rhodococcus sp. SGAir0479]
MSTTPARSRLLRRVVGGGRVRAALSLGIVLGLGSVGTLAAWSDSATATSADFQTGVADLKLGPDPGVDTYSFSAFGGSGLRPGRQVQAALDVRNKGDVPFRYSVTAKATGNSAVAQQISLTVYPNSACSGTTTLGTLTAMSAADQTLVSGKGPLALNGAETVCVQATVGNSVTKAMQNQAINVVFTFTATSV